MKAINLAYSTPTPSPLLSFYQSPNLISFAMYLSIIALVAALTVHSTALPQLKPLALDISKAVEKRQGPAGIIPEIIMVAIVDAGGPAVEAFGFGAQITAELFGDLDQDEPYVRFLRLSMVCI